MPRRAYTDVFTASFELNTIFYSFINQNGILKSAGKPMPAVIFAI